MLHNFHSFKDLLKFLKILNKGKGVFLCNIIMSFLQPCDLNYSSLMCFWIKMPQKNTSVKCKRTVLNVGTGMSTYMVQRASG